MDLSKWMDAVKAVLARTESPVFHQDMRDVASAVADLGHALHGMMEQLHKPADGIADAEGESH